MNGFEDVNQKAFLLRGQSQASNFVLFGYIFTLFLVLKSANATEFGPPTLDFKFTAGNSTMALVGRRVTKSVLSVEQAEGVGARVRRSVGRAQLNKVMFGYIFTLFLVLKSANATEFDPPTLDFKFTAGNSTMALVGRRVTKSVLSVEQAEGVGARVRRSVGRAQLPKLDPFLLLDEFRVAKPAGFPDHPHRGFETVTYMLKGAFRHEDFKGHSGVIGPGDLQVCLLYTRWNSPSCA
ncbi:Pirin [Holothuria leucospilota]|uniref:Pirin n=1 Tax=Holothuria leucospilota TaxID=206669 RepID=A0A9Q1C8K3_HOLLE|nr:Pirin [Holothuria leucospilota]